MNVLVACEFTGVVRDAFISCGHNAMSCDLLPSESNAGPHYQGSVFDLDLTSYDLVIAHPPCTALCVSGNRWYSNSEERYQAALFVGELWSRVTSRLCLENPVGVINTLLPHLPKPQYIQPWQFGHGETKKTGLWLRGLSPLSQTNVVSGRDNRIWKMPPSKDRSKLRSLTYPGIADAMATQWGALS
ncbi:hypothetical protein [Neptunomonas japonica]|uniref:hypothetical protein n=1 Tax=Neptunomonas japonica TaxID=417574 RepID=UPI0004162C40|nr:hypothetical protein [Neptunomonas japonica]